jgi:hypothetical protein
VAFFGVWYGEAGDVLRAVFFHTAANEKQLRARDVSCAIMLNRFAIAEIKALRAKLNRFSSKQKDPSVQFHCLLVDSNLAQALLGRDDPMLREVLASSIAQLEESLQQSGSGAACTAPACEARPSVKGLIRQCRVTDAESGGSAIVVRRSLPLRRAFF